MERRERGKQGCERETTIGCLSQVPQANPTATSAHAPTRNQELNPQPVGPRDNTPTNWATPTRALLVVLNSVANSIFRKKHRIPFYSSFTWDWITELLQSSQDKLTDSPEPLCCAVSCFPSATSAPFGPHPSSWTSLASSLTFQGQGWKTDQLDYSKWTQHRVILMSDPHAP